MIKDPPFVDGKNKRIYPSTGIFRNSTYTRSARNNRKTRASPARWKKSFTAAFKLRNYVITGGGVLFGADASGNLGIAPLISISRVASLRPRAYDNEAAFNDTTERKLHENAA